MNTRFMADDHLKQTRENFSANEADKTLPVSQDITKISQSHAPSRARTFPPNARVLDDPLIGQCLNDQYLIQAPLGSGGMSVVYKALNQSIDRLVAVKTIKLAMMSDAVVRARFEREIKSLAKLNHVNIVTTYDCVTGPQGQSFIVMDYIDGDSLDKVLDDVGALEQTRAAKIFIQVCSALEHAHRQGIVHRDLKPANIMISKDLSGNELVKVVDFGLAKVMEETQRLTSTGQLWGSIPYMSPEQCSTTSDGTPIDHRTDVYSLGVSMYEALTGMKPFASENVIEIVAKHLYEEPLPFSERNPLVHVLPNLEAVVFTALRKERSERFQTMREMKEAIEFAAAPLLAADQKMHEESMQQRQSANLKNSIRRSAPKKPASLSSYLQKKKQNKLKLPLIVGLTAIATAAVVYLVMVGSRVTSPAAAPVAQSPTDFKPTSGQNSTAPVAVGNATTKGAAGKNAEPVNSVVPEHSQTAKQPIAHVQAVEEPGGGRPTHTVVKHPPAKSKRTLKPQPFDLLLHQRSDEVRKPTAPKKDPFESLKNKRGPGAD